MIVIKGIAAIPGISIGKAYVVEDEDIVVERVELARDRIKEEVRRFKQAQKATLRDLDAAEQKVLKVLGKQHAKLIDAHRLILKDTLITQDVAKRIVEERVNAEFALSEALDQVNRQFVSHRCRFSSLGAFQNRQSYVDRITEEDPCKTGGDDAGNANLLDDYRRLFP